MASRLYATVWRALLLTWLSALPLALLLITTSARSDVLSLLSLASNVIKVSKDTPKTLDVTAEGTGETREKALSNATINAVKQALGTMIISSQTAVNNELVSSNIVERTAGVVNHYDVNHCDVDATKGGLYVCEIKATVSSELVIKGLESNGAKVVLVDGEQVYGQQVTYRTKVQSTRELIIASVKDYESRGVYVNVKSVTPTPSFNGRTPFDVMVEVGVHKEWYDSFLGAIKAIGDSSGRDLYIYGTGFFKDHYGFEDKAILRFLTTYFRGQALVEVRAIDKDSKVMTGACFMASAPMEIRYIKTAPYDPPTFAEAYWFPTLPVHTQKVMVPESMLPRINAFEAVVGCPHKYQIVN